jgi:hypothetical protein
MADGINAAVERDQMTLLDQSMDLCWREPERNELPSLDDAELNARELREAAEERLTGASRGLTPYG